MRFWSKDIPKWNLGIWVIACLLFSNPNAYSQRVNIGVPPIWHFSKKIYGAATQNWDAAQDAQNRIYFANNDGLLRYDGTRWICLPVANHTIVRSIAIDGDGRIFTGAQSEIGYFFPDERGVLSYTSLVGLLSPDQRSFEDVWDIVLHEGHAFFRTNRAVIEYGPGLMKLHTRTADLHSLFQTPFGLLLQETNQNLFILKDGSFVPFMKVQGLESSITGAMTWEGDTVICSSLKNGLFFLTATNAGKWKTPADALFEEKRIYSATRLPNGHLALGTSLHGLIVLDQYRRVFTHLDKKLGLQNNNILSTFCDRSGNVWLGLDNGIDCVVLDSRFTSIFPDGELQATGYSAAVFNNQLYLGVSNGAYYTPWQTYYNPEQSPFFQRVTYADGQVWGFNVISDELLMGHHEGAFQIRDWSANAIANEPGTWIYLPLSDSFMLAGTYTGLVVYHKTRDGWKPHHQIEGIHESCRILVKDEDGSVWVSHPYRGLYHVQWQNNSLDDPQIRFFDQSGGLPSNLNNYVFSIAGEAVFGTEKGVYRFDRGRNRFFQDSTFNRLLGEGNRVKAMKEDADGNIWFVTDAEVGVLVVEDQGLKKEINKKVFPELLNKLVGGFEFIYPVDRNNVIFGTEEGFVHYDASPREVEDDTLHLLFNNIRADMQQDSVLFGGYFLPDQVNGLDRPHLLAAGMNNLSFSFSATDYKTPSLIEYRSRLEGLEEEWSSWNNDTRRDFSSLGPGTYRFMVQARKVGGTESPVISYYFRIRPPWFKTTLAMLFYGLGIVGGFVGYMMQQRKKFETEKAQLTVTHQEKEARAFREVEQSKAALTEIQNEKLEVEIKSKNQELALTTMHLVQKAEILLSIQDSLHQIKDKTPVQEVKKDIQQILSLINSDVKLDEDWEHFAHHFDQVHVNFLKHLREQYPQLSVSDLKLCAYLRMNLSTKEIAPLLNISIRGVEGSRYRLRKKLNLPNDANLTDFILGITPHPESHLHTNGSRGKISPEVSKN